MDVLPSELLYEVLDHISVEPDYVQRQLLLRQTSLVARRWRAPSQRLLWARVELCGETTGQMFLESERTSQEGIIDLTVSSLEHGLKASTVKKVLETTKEVQILDMGGFWGSSMMSLEDLYLPSLKNLHILILNRPLSVPADITDLPTTPPFTLHRLCLGSQDYPPSLLHSLLPPHSPSPHLTSLTFAVGESKPGFQTLLDLFPSVASSLEDLGLWWSPIDLPSLADLSRLPDLSPCKNLTSFRLIGYNSSMEGLFSILEAIPSRLERLSTFTYDMNEEAFEEFVKCLELNALKGLKTWGVSGSDPGVLSTKAAAVFFETCRKKGVRVLVPYP